jgi:hypothetical protein
VKGSDKIKGNTQQNERELEEKKMKKKQMMEHCTKIHAHVL